MLACFMPKRGISAPKCHGVRQLQSQRGRVRYSCIRFARCSSAATPARGTKQRLLRAWQLCAQHWYCRTGYWHLYCRAGTPNCRRHPAPHCTACYCRSPLHTGCTRAQTKAPGRSCTYHNLGRPCLDTHPRASTAWTAACPKRWCARWAGELLLCSAVAEPS